MWFQIQVSNQQTKIAMSNSTLYKTPANVQMIMKLSGRYIKNIIIGPGGLHAPCVLACNNQDYISLVMNV